MVQAELTFSILVVFKNTVFLEFFQPTLSAKVVGNNKLKENGFI